jgi:cytochrome P450
MCVVTTLETQPPEADEPFDIGSTDDSLQRMIGLFGRLGDTYRVYAPLRKSYTYVIHHPDDVKRVLVSNHRNYTKGAGIDRIKLLLGKGIMTSEDELWRRQRSMMQPSRRQTIVSSCAGRRGRPAASW